MICKYCETENPEGSVYCLHCGKRLDGKIFCPSCKSLCPEEALYCNACGARITKAQPAAESEEKQSAQAPQAAAEVAEVTEVAPKTKSGIFEKVKKAFDLSGGICLMVAVLFAFVFVFCIGLTATVSGSYLDGDLSETTTLWRFFGEAYKDLAETLGKLDYYSAYYEISAYLPVVLSTVICAATLLCVLIFTIIAAVKYGRHFKKPEVKYGKFGIAAVLSFILGATAILAINSSASIGISSLLRVSIRFSDATIAGIVLSLAFLWLYLVSRVVILGKEFITKRALVNFVCTLVGILFTVLVLSFAASPAFVLKEVGSRTNKVGLNFSALNVLISNLFPEPDKLSTAMEADYTVTYVVSALAQGVQITLLVLAFTLLIKRASGLGGDSKSCLGISITMIILAAVQLALTCTAIACGNKLIASVDAAELVIGAAPIVAFIASAFALADAITHKVLLSKTAEQQQISKDEA